MKLKNIKQKKRFQELQRLLGLNIDLGRLSAKNTQDLTIFKNQQKLQSKMLVQVKKQIKIEIEQEFTKSVGIIKNEYHKSLDQYKFQYEQQLSAKVDKIENFLTQFKKYREKQKSQINQIVDELLDLYDIIISQGKVIDKNETGGYNGGLNHLAFLNKINLICQIKLSIKSINLFYSQQSLFHFLDTNSVTTIEKTNKTATKQLRQSSSQIILEIDYNQLDSINFMSIDLVL
ncbi:unnamed protein product [Paramecium sonneborni]|uniref:Uncharacterized protein n=1 Tax=Paramecium sonneborni TaxID=65129 RepID=A0A8S1R349_9CILI|nr:unnamed protein product [Paramecium sonneborni]